MLTEHTESQREIGSMRKDDDARFHAMFEELVAEGLWERVGDAYQPTAKGKAIMELDDQLGHKPVLGRDYGNS